MEKSQVKADPFFPLTQNALADNTYLEYVRSMYGGKIYVPTTEDSRNVSRITRRTRKSGWKLINSCRVRT